MIRVRIKGFWCRLCFSWAYIKAFFTILRKYVRAWAIPANFVKQQEILAEYQYRLGEYGPVEAKRFWLRMAMEYPYLFKPGSG